MTRAPIIDTPDIGDRMRELQAERTRLMFACTCTRDTIDAGGNVIRTDNPSCPACHPPSSVGDLLVGVDAHLAEYGLRR